MPLPRNEPSLTRENAQVIAYERIKDWIINGPLEAGETVRDTDVAAMLGVSRTPVREALIRLSQENLVTISVGRPTKVAELDFSRAEHHYTLGGLLDGHAAERAASRIESEAIERMRKLLDEMAAEENVARVQRLDEEFHLVYYLAAGNPVLIELMDRINAETRRIERAAFREPQIRQQAHQEHIAILEALAAGDAETAKALAVSNWQNSWERIHAAVEPKVSAG